MASTGVELLGLTLAVTGWLGVMVACGLPMWRVAAYVGQNVLVSQVIWEGLWMNCSVQSTGQMHCKVHDSTLGLAPDLQAARALVLVSVTLGVAGTALAAAGAKCTDCGRDREGKRRLATLGGLLLTLAGLSTLTAVSWTARVIAAGFYDPLLEETGKRDFGNALYFGWAASSLLVLGGALLWCPCGGRREVGDVVANSRRGKSDYV
ncbi:claudin-4-like [Stigmatopora nigra]